LAAVRVGLLDRTHPADEVVRAGRAHDVERFGPVHLLEQVDDAARPVAE
jgi:hypothetical protein